MSRDIKYIGTDVHKEAIVIAVLGGSGAGCGCLPGTLQVSGATLLGVQFHPP